MKRTFTITLLIILILTIVTQSNVFANKDDIYSSSGNILKTLGILEGTETGDLKLKDNLTRQDMVVMISRLYKDEDKAKTFLTKPKFKDIPEDESGKFYSTYIGWAVEKNLIKGMDKDNFGYGEDVTVQQYQTVLLRALGYVEESGLWNSVPDFAKTFGLMTDLENNPKDLITRGQMAVMTLNTLKQTKKGSTLTLAQVLNIEIKVEEPIARGKKK